MYGLIQQQNPSSWSNRLLARRENAYNSFRYNHIKLFVAIIKTNEAIETSCHCSCRLQLSQSWPCYVPGLLQVSHHCNWIGSSLIMVSETNHISGEPWTSASWNWALVPESHIICMVPMRWAHLVSCGGISSDRIPKVDSLWEWGLWLLWAHIFPVRGLLWMVFMCSLEVSIAAFLLAQVQQEPELCPDLHFHYFGQCCREHRFLRYV